MNDDQDRYERMAHNFCHAIALFALAVVVYCVLCGVPC